MWFTETWLNELTMDSLVMLDGFQLVRADRMAKESGKRKGGGIAMFVNNRWCNPGHINVKEQLCTKDIELLAVSMRPYYIPREFSHIIAITVYIPPSADASAACELLHRVVSQLQTSHPQCFFLISGDFNHALLSSTLPTFTQYVKCHTRDNKTLDLLYANIKEAYSSSPLPLLGRSDHNLVHLLSAYIPLVSKQPPTTRYVREWSEEASEALRDCFETTDWEMLCNCHGEDIDTLTHCVTDYINFCVENTIPKKKVRCFSNNKPWVTSELKALLNEKKILFKSGEKEELRRVQKQLRLDIRKGKDSYRKRLESRLLQNNMREVWRGLKTISGQNKVSGKGFVSGDCDRANELNLFFNRFDSTPSPPTPNRTSDLSVTQPFPLWPLRTNSSSLRASETSAPPTSQVSIDSSFMDVLYPSPHLFSRELLYHHLAVSL